MSSETEYCDWIAADWGTSRLRVWAMRGDNPIAASASDKGMGHLERAEFEPALLELIDPWLGTNPVNVIICGMAGSRQGWVEAPYAAVPCQPISAATATPEVRDQRLRVHILPGLKQAAPPDVMRGEETQIAGFLAGSQGFSGVICLPGTHTKWAQISAGEVVSFRTFMSGELFALISTQSVLRHTVGPGWDEKAFLEALADSMSRPEAIASRLFTIRATALLDTMSPEAGRSRISGLLIGAELAAARPYWLGQDVAIIGSAEQSNAYAQALESQGLAPRVHDGDQMTLAGLALANKGLKETNS